MKKSREYADAIVAQLRPVMGKPDEREQIVKIIKGAMHEFLDLFIADTHQLEGKTRTTRELISTVKLVISKYEEKWFLIVNLVNKDLKIEMLDPMGLGKILKNTFDEVLGRHSLGTPESMSMRQFI